jgi:hypothetical protein
MSNFPAPLRAPEGLTAVMEGKLSSDNGRCKFSVSAGHHLPNTRVSALCDPDNSAVMILMD